MAQSNKWEAEFSPLKEKSTLLFFFSAIVKGKIRVLITLFIDIFSLLIDFPCKLQKTYFIYNPQIQISAESETKRSIFRKRDKTKRSKKESAQHSKSRNKSFVMTSVSAL